MGIADAILDLVSSGTTLKENNLKEIEGGLVLESQVCATLWSNLANENLQYVPSSKDSKLYILPLDNCYI